MLEVKLDQNVRPFKHIDDVTEVQEVILIDDDVEDYWVVLSHGEQSMSMSLSNFEKLNSLIEKAKSKMFKIERNELKRRKNQD